MNTTETTTATPTNIASLTLADLKAARVGLDVEFEDGTAAIVHRSRGVYCVTWYGADDRPLATVMPYTYQTWTAAKAALTAWAADHAAEDVIMGEPGVPTPEMLAEADRLEEQAKRHRQSREESFSRCDTDGFLSQWADGINARLDERRAALLRAGGKDTFPGLYHGTRRVNAKLIERPSFKGWGTDLVWLLADTEAAQYGRRFIPHGDNSKVQRSLGLCERQEWAEARAEIMGGGRGLSGCASAFVGVERTDTWGWDSRK